MSKPRITIEYRPAGYLNLLPYLWRVTLPNGKSRYGGAVGLFTISEVMSSKRLRQWARKNGVAA